MKKLFLVPFFLLLAAPFFAQSFKIAENRASIGVGFGWYNKSPYAKSIHFPTPNILIERSVINVPEIGVIVVGAGFGFHYGYHKAVVPNSVQKYKESWTEVYFLPRAVFYFQEFFYEYDLLSNVDLYVGLAGGFNVLNHETKPMIADIENKSGMRFEYDVFAGARYYIRQKLAFSAEIGYGLAFAKFGVTLKY